MEKTHPFGEFMARVEELENPRRKRSLRARPPQIPGISIDQRHPLFSTSAAATGDFER